MTCPRCDRPTTPDALRQFGGMCPACVAQFAAQEDAPAFPDLEILGLIGEGGMGVVYRARQTRLDRTVALKVLSPHLGGDPDFVARFTKEARALAQLSHPNIVAIHDSGVHDGVPYLVMEYVEGRSLRALMAGRKLAAEEALRIVPQICDALQYAHARGVVHRDVKPENILVDREGRVKIADFGLAKVGGADATRVTRSNVMMGTPNYMAPEQIENTAGVDHRADIYSLGVVFYEMLTGELPLGRFKPPSEKSTVDARLDPVVLKSLEKDPELRYQSATEVKNHVARLDTVPVAARPAGLLPRVFGLVSFSMALLLLAVHLSMLLLAGADLHNGLATIRSRLGADGFAAYQILTTLGGIAATVAGFVALGSLAAARSLRGAWAAVIGIALSTGLASVPHETGMKTVMVLALPVIYAAAAVVLGFAGRDVWKGPGYAAVASGLVAVACAIAAYVSHLYHVPDAVLPTAIGGGLFLACAAGCLLADWRLSLLAALAALALFLATAILVGAVASGPDGFLSWTRILPVAGALLAVGLGTAARIRIARSEGRLRGRALALLAQYAGGGLALVAALFLLVQARPPAMPAEARTASRYGSIREWRLELNRPLLGLVPVGERLFAASSDGLTEIDPVRGEVIGRWTGTIDAPPVSRNGWLIARGSERIVVFRPADGPLEPWHVFALADRGAIADASIGGNVAYLGTATGRALALDLEGRKLLWERENIGFPVTSSPALLPREAVFHGGRRPVALDRTDGRLTGGDRSAGPLDDPPLFRAGAFPTGRGWAVLLDAANRALLGTFEPGRIEWNPLPTALEPGPLDLALIEDVYFVRSSWGVRAWRPGTATWCAAIEGGCSVPVPLRPGLAALATRSGLRLVEPDSGTVMRTGYPDSLPDDVLAREESLLLLYRRTGSLESIRLSGPGFQDTQGETVTLTYSSASTLLPAPLPPGVRILSETEGVEALQRARMPTEMMTDLVTVRRVTLAPGSVELVELAFRTEVALRRWFQDSRMSRRFPPPGEGALGTQVRILAAPPNPGAKATAAVLTAQPRNR